MATLTVQVAAEGGGKTFAAVSSSDVFANDGRTILVIHNANAAPTTVTATAQSTSTTKSQYGTVTKADAVQVVEGTSVDIMGPFPTGAFNNSSGQVVIGYSATATVTAAVIRIPNPS